MTGLSRGRLIGATAAALAIAPQIARSQTLTTLRVASQATDDTTPVQYAIQKGWYKKAGLDVQFVQVTSGTVATEAVLSGTYELGKGSPIAFLVAHLKGFPMTLVGNANVWNPKVPFSLMLVPADSTVKSGADLNGMILGTAAIGDINALAMNAWIDQTGGDSKTIKWVEISNAAGGAALAEHRIAATMLQEPQLTSALETGKVRVLAPAYSAISLHMTSGIYFAQSDWAAKNAATVQSFMRVTYASAAYTNNHHAETAPMMADITKIPLDVITKISRNTSATSTDPSYLQSVIDVAAKYKAIPNWFPAKEAYFTE